MKTDQTMKYIEISNSEKELMHSSLAGVVYSPDGNLEYIKKIRKLMWRFLPERILDELENLRSQPPNFGGIVITNLPLDEAVYGSPYAGETGRSFKNGSLSENLLVGIGAILGEPYSIAHEGHELVNNLTPHKDKINDFTGLGSGVELDFHIENAAQVYQEEGDTSPFVLVLLGVREDTNAQPMTRLSDARIALSSLSSDDIEALREPLYVIKVPHRWRAATSILRDNTGLVPVLSGPLNAPRITVAFYPDMVIPISTRARNALMNMHKAVRDVSVGIHINPGTMVIINNNFVLHSRDRFSASYDQEDRAYRWVQRIFVTKNLWPFRQFSQLTDRVFNAELLENVR